jgi:peptide chain release factor 3
MTPVFRLRPAAVRGGGAAGRIGDYAPAGPEPVKACGGDAPIIVEPRDREVTGFVFKVQANMDPAHRDRIAFVKLCSGKFTRGMKLKVQNTGRQLSVHNPMMFFASEREIADEAFAGRCDRHPEPRRAARGRLAQRERDAALRRPAQLRAGDPAACAGEGSAQGQAPEAALEGLAEEGVTQLFRPMMGSSDFIVGAVGPLQFESWPTG